MENRGKSPAIGRRAFLLGTSAFAVAACSNASTTAEEAESAEAAATAETPTPTAAQQSPTSAPSATTPSSAAPEPGPTAEPAPTVEPTEEPEPEPTAESPQEPEPGEQALTGALFDALGICTLIPSSTAGPYPSRALLDRRIIHDGYPGHPFRLGLRVVDPACVPIPGATVEIWHTDASGDYSQYEDGGSGKDEGEETSFCRGAQTADAEGIVEFETIYPGWYDSRAVHIHVRVYVEGETVRTAQLYFDEDYTAAICQTGEYAQFGLPETTWADDRLVGDPATDGSGVALSAAPVGGLPGTLGLVNLGVDPNAA